MEAPTTAPPPDSYSMRGFRLKDRNFDELQAEARRENRSAAGQLNAILEERYDNNGS